MHKFSESISSSSVSQHSESLREALEGNDIMESDEEDAGTFDPKLLATLNSKSFKE